MPEKYLLEKYFKRKILTTIETLLNNLK